MKINNPLSIKNDEQKPRPKEAFKKIKNIMEKKTENPLTQNNEVFTLAELKQKVYALSTAIEWINKKENLSFDKELKLAEEKFNNVEKMIDKQRTLTLLSKTIDPEAFGDKMFELKLELRNKEIELSNNKKDIETRRHRHLTSLFFSPEQIEKRKMEKEHDRMLWMLEIEEENEENKERMKFAQTRAAFNQSLKDRVKNASGIIASDRTRTD